MDGMTSDPFSDDFAGALAGGRLAGGRDQAARRVGPRAPGSAGDIDRRFARLGLPESGNELLAMLTFLTAPDGPLAQVAASGRLDGRNREVLGRMQRRVTVIEDFLRARIASFVAASERGEGSFARELALAGADLDTSRALETVVDGLLMNATPAEQEFDLLADKALEIYGALEAAQGPEADGRGQR